MLNDLYGKIEGVINAVPSFVWTIVIIACAGMMIWSLVRIVLAAWFTAKTTTMLLDYEDARKKKVAEILARRKAAREAKKKGPFQLPKKPGGEEGPTWRYGPPK